MTERRGPNPLLYFVLNLPFGATSGFVTVALAYVATHHGVSISEVASLAAMTVFPQTYKFLWAPIVDAIWTRKRWYVAGCIVSSATIASMGLVPIVRENVGLLRSLIFVNAVAAAFLGMSVEAIMAHATPDAERGRASGWLQAGNLGGSGIGGGIVLWLLLYLPVAWMATTCLALLLLGCSFALVGVPEPLNEEGTLGARMMQVVRDLWQVMWSSNGAIAVALCFLPMGAGAALGLFSAVAEQWGASAEMVEATNGWWSGAAMIAGCIAGGRLSDKMNRKAAYPLAGGVLALFACIMALSPRTPVTYVVLCLGYSVITGACYATFTGFVLEVIGSGAAATKYNIFASLSNIPIWYMTQIDGWAADRAGAARMLFVDAAAGAAGIALLLLVIAAVRALAPNARVATD